MPGCNTTIRIRQSITNHRRETIPITNKCQAFLRRLIRQINYEVKGIMILLYSHSPSVDPPQAMGRAVLVEQG